MRQLTSDEHARLAFVVTDADAWWGHVNRPDNRARPEVALANKLEKTADDYANNRRLFPLGLRVESAAAVRAQYNRPLKREVPMLYKNLQGGEATRQDALDFIDFIDAQIDSDATAERQATADTVQAIIDADVKLTREGVRAVSDSIDSGAVRLVFPADDPEASSMFWQATHAVMVDAYGAEVVDEQTVRVRLTKAASHLAFIAAQLKPEE